MKNFKNFVSSLMLVLMVAVSAQAVPYLPGVDVLQGFGLVSSIGAVEYVGSPDISPDGSHVTIDGKFSGMGDRIAYLGISQVIDTSAYDSFSLFLSNNNENPWNFGLWVLDAGVLRTTAAVSMPNDHVFRYFNLNFSDVGVGSASVSAFGYYVGERVPIITTVGGVLRADRAFETGVAPVPEPGTLLLLGSGLVGLAWYGRKRKQV